MKVLSKLFALLVIMQFSITLRALCNDYYIKRKGYLINFGIYGWFFQPCDNTNIKLLESLNSSSFHVLYGTDGYNNALRVFENTDEMITDTVFYGKPLEELDNVGVIKYKYVEMTYRSDQGTQSIPNCMVEFSTTNNEQKRYRLGCLWFKCEIKKIR